MTRFRGGLIYQLFELIEPPMPDKDNPAPCPYIPMQWTELGGGDLPVVPIISEYMGMVLDCPFLSLETQLDPKSGK